MFPDRDASGLDTNYASVILKIIYGETSFLLTGDSPNVIENYFKPGKEFVYFEEGHLEEKIDEILQNYDYYQEIAMNAYKRAIKEYTTKAFAKNILSKI